MAKQIFNGNYGVDVPSLVLARRDYTKISKVIHATDIVYKENLNSPTLSFTVYKDKKWNHWEDINNYNLIFVPEYKEYFAMHVNTNDENTTQKTVECVYFPQDELQNSAKIHNLEINTEEDIKRTDYDADYPTIFCRDLSNYQIGSEMYEKLYHASLLHRIMSYATNYTIGHVDTSLMNLDTWFQYTISESNVFDVLNGEVAEDYHCLFKFDSVNKTVNVYDLYNTCNECGYRGDFHDECPECNSKDFSGAFGEDTTIFVSKENLATAASIEANKDNLKNCFYVQSGDDLMTSAISITNPNGSNYIFNFSAEMYKNMPENLVAKIEEYNELYTECLNTRSYTISNELVTAYNQVVAYINQYYPIQDLDVTVKNRYETISSPFIGYKSISSLCYNCIDMSLDLEHSMGKTIQMDNLTIQETMNLLTSANLSPIAVKSDASQVSQSVVENTIIGACKSLINTALYKVEINTGDYNKTTHVWTGSFKLTSIEDETVTLVGNAVSISVNSAKDPKDKETYETYLKQNIQRELNKLDTNYKDLKKLDLPDADFQSELKYYSKSYLEGLLTSFNSCLGIIVDSDNDELKNQYTTWYSNHIGYIEIEIGIRENYLKSVYALYDYTNQSGVVYDIQQSLKTELNFELFLGKDLYSVFNSYRMEDTYKNENYISDGLDNGQLITRASELIDMAKKELYKASHIQYTVNATMNNLLVLPEFQSIIDKFAVGNWIHVCVDEVIYCLRLLCYTIYFDDIPKIDVEFSTVEKIPSGTSDVDSTLKAAQNIAGSYSNDSQKIKNSQNSSKYVENWVSKGFDATANKIVNNADNQSVVYDSSGILCRSYDDITDEYGLCASRVLNSGFYVTDDGWKTVKSAVGKYVYLDPRDNTYKTTMGVLAQTFVGQAILGETFGIYNASGSMSFDDKGLVIKNDINSVTINPNDNSKLFKITKGTTDTFYTDNEGNLNLTGNINGGTITLGSGKFKVDDKGNITTTGDVSLANGNLVYDSNTKKLTVNGIVNASGGTFSGNISSTATITGSNLRGGSIGIGGNNYDNFIVSTNGDLTTKGSITSNGNLIVSGNMNIGGNKLIYDKTNGLSISGNIDAKTILATEKYSIFSNNQAIDVITSRYYVSGVSINSYWDVMFKLNDYGKIQIKQTPGAFVMSDDQTEGHQHVGINIIADDIRLKGSTETSNLMVDKEIYTKQIFVNSKELFYSHIYGSEQLYRVGVSKDCTYFRPYMFDDGNADCNGLVSLGSGTHQWKNIYAMKSEISTSDRNKKHNILPISEKYEKLFMNILPVTYMFNDGDRIHIGAISQDIEQAMSECGISDLEFAGLCKDIHYIYDKDEKGISVKESRRPQTDENGNIVYDYALRYQEFIMLIVHMLQKTINDFDEYKKVTNETLSTLITEIITIKKTMV